MAITDQTILAEMQRVTLEGVGDLGATWPSGMWTLTEVLGYLNQRQNHFRATTGLLWTRTETAITINQADQAAPADWIATIFLALKASTGLYRELPKVDVSELDLADASWPGATAVYPTGYYEIDGVTRTTYVVPIPTDPGSALERYYVSMGTALTQAGVDFSVPDEFVPTIKYGALADMFSKVGQARNPALALACEERWQEGVELGKVMAAEGWFVL
jgi:hypothetical protein